MFRQPPLFNSSMSGISLGFITTEPNRKCQPTYLKINEIQNFQTILRSFYLQVTQRRTIGSSAFVSARQNSIFLFPPVSAHSSVHVWGNWFISKSKSAYDGLYVHKRYEGHTCVNARASLRPRGSWGCSPHHSRHNTHARTQTHTIHILKVAQLNAPTEWSGCKIVWFVTRAPNARKCRSTQCMSEVLDR